MRKNITKNIILLGFILFILRSNYYVFAETETVEKDAVLNNIIVNNEIAEENIAIDEIIDKEEINEEKIDDLEEIKETEEKLIEEENKEENKEEIVEEKNVLNNILTTPEPEENYYTGEEAETEKRENKFSNVTEEMLDPEYWEDKTIIDKDKEILNNEDIDRINQEIVNNKASTNVRDLTTFPDTFDADNIRNSLASDAILTRALYINGTLINNTEYFTNLQNAMRETGFTGTKNTIYSICTNRADLKSWPIDDVIGYSATDPDDEMESAALNLNEPFIIMGVCQVGENKYYWGYSTNCTGWINAKNLAICDNKEEWLGYWKVETTNDDFVVVIDNQIDLKKENSEDKNMMLGTILKLVPDEEIPVSLKNKIDENYVVYIPSKDEEGNAKKEIAILDKNLNVNQGFLKLTQTNFLKAAFSCIGDPYGWGGMEGKMDCSLYTRSIYKCFGLELPRNTTWQQYVPNQKIDISKMTDEEKDKLISTLPAGALLYFSGHAMAYIGMDDNKNFVISDMGSAIEEGGTALESVNCVNVNSLIVIRKTGTTWLNNLVTIINLSNDIDIKDCEVLISDQDFIYDGNEKKPVVTLKYNGNYLFQDINFKVEYINNVDTGIATIKINGINNFDGEIYKTFEIKNIEDVKNNENANTNTETNNILKEDTKINVPKTGDNFELIIILCAISLLGLMITRKK